MMKLRNIKNILFDCDGVLYQDLEAVFGQVSKKMTEYISKKLNLDLKVARELQRSYFHKYDTSLNGLMIRRPPRSTPLYSSAASDVYRDSLYQRIFPINMNVFLCH